MNQRQICGFLFLLFATLLPCDDVLAEKLALVIGVSSYGQDRAAREASGFIVPTELPNTVRDARLLEHALKKAGFVVQLIVDPDRRQLIRALDDFADTIAKAKPHSTGLVYFAGHGAQGRPLYERDVDNYLIPIGADLKSEIDLQNEAIPLSRITFNLSKVERSSVILILDACRDFALPQADRSTLNQRGLAEARAGADILIAYSTAPGKVAFDGPPGQNGPYASALAHTLTHQTPIRAEDLFYRVRQSVLKVTGGLQQPWENSSLLRPITIGIRSELLEEHYNEPSPTSPARDQRDTWNRAIELPAANPPAVGRYLDDRGCLREADGSFVVGYRSECR